MTRASLETSMASFNIGQAAARSGVSPKMVRHYESLGLLPTVHRTEAGYRLYTDKEVHTLQFIKRARDLGFAMTEIAQLVKLWQNRRRSSADVRRIAMRHVVQLDERLAEMASMKRTLQHLIDCCDGDNRPACPILDELERRSPGDSASPPRPAAHRRHSLRERARHHRSS